MTPPRDGSPKGEPRQDRSEQSSKRSRYRFNLQDPLFTFTAPVQIPALTEPDLDRLASSLRKATQRLEEYDQTVGARLVAVTELADPWWQELRPHLLRRGWGPGAELDEEVGSCAMALSFRDETWLPPLLREIATKVDPAPLVDSVAEHIPALALLNTGRLDGAIALVCTFISMPRATARSAPDDPEPFWLASFGGLLGWAAEFGVLFEERLAAIEAAHEQIEQLRWEVETVRKTAGVEKTPGVLDALYDALLHCRRLINGLAEEVGRTREKLIESLAIVMAVYGITWCSPLPEAVKTLANEVGKIERQLAELKEDAR